MASGARRFGLIAGFAAYCCMTFACVRGASDVAASWTFQPTQPSTNAETVVRLSLADTGGTPVKGARLRLEAHMAHPGMAPVVGELIETEVGVYETRVKLTMAGPWVIVVAGELPDGRRIVKQTQVTAAQPSS